MWARVVDRAETPALQAGSGGQGPAGPQGPKGDTGATGPQGPAGAGGGTGGAQFLSGDHAPISGSGLLPLDGINDPWRWFQGMQGWIGPAYNVTWHAGDTVGFLPSLPESNEEYALWIGSVSTPTEANQNQGQFHDSSEGVQNNAVVSNIFRGRLFDGPGGTSGETQVTNAPGVAAADGSGIAFLFQMERNATGPTAVPDPTWGADVTNLRAVLGPDVVIGAPFAFNEAGDGNDGDFWLDTSTVDLYGPRADGAWPAPMNIWGFDPTKFHRLTDTTVFGPNQNAEFGAPSIIVESSPEPNVDGYLTPGQVAVWYEPTTGAPVVHFKGKDESGTVYVASLPMTPA